MSGELLGIYRGVPLHPPHARHAAHAPRPDRDLPRPDPARRPHPRQRPSSQIRDTVIHELGHYFGLGDRDMVY